MTRSLSTLALVLFVVINIQRVISATTNDCSCGYSVNLTSSQDHAVFTDLLETDFLHLDSIFGNECWQPQVYNVTAAAGRGEYGKMATLDNVVPNPLANATAWSGQGVRGGDAGLQLWVRSHLQNGLVPMGEILALRTDMKHGSYRVGMKLTHVPGTCGAFFWYRDNIQEIDMEFLSATFNDSSRQVNLVMQTPESQAAGFNAAGTPTFDVNQLPFLPSDGFHEYRFDWTEEKVSFYADGNWIYDMKYKYPETPGHIAFNHWSNGNSKWSRGPPLQDAVLTISYVKAYFNTSDTKKQATFDTNCVDRAQVCQIPDEHDAGAQTHFFDGQSCGEYPIPKSSVHSGSTSRSYFHPTSTVVKTATATATSTVFAGAGTSLTTETSATGSTLEATGSQTSTATENLSTGVSMAITGFRPFTLDLPYIRIKCSYLLLTLTVSIMGLIP